MNVAGLVGIIIFYLLILIVGIWAARKKKDPADGDESSQTEEVILAGRSIGCFVGTFTMTATWVGGGYINGTAELVYTTGLSAAQAPWGYATSLFLGGILFARKMREAGYVTMLDPLQERFGKIMGGVLYIPALFGEIFWSAAILGSLGATLSVVLNVNIDYAVVASACVAVGYTFFGGLYAVAFTDVLQLICIVVGLWLTIPFAMLHKHVDTISSTQDQWIGTIHRKELGGWIDHAFLLVFGGIPWQVYFQRVLSSKSARYAQFLSFSAAFGCIVMAIPAVLIGAVARSTDWVSVITNSSLITATGAIKDQRLVLPMVLQYLTPTWVSFIGLGAVSAAVMSSADSSVLSASSMFSYNIYKLVIRQKASSKELIWVIRIGIFIVGAIATVMGLTIKSIYDLWVLSSDLVYVLLFPQLLCAVYLKFVNVYGSASSFSVGLLLRILAGEPTFGLPVIMKYPYYDEVNKVQQFPFRTIAMFCSLATLLVVSAVTNYLFDLDPERDEKKSAGTEGINMVRMNSKKKNSISKVSPFPVDSNGVSPKSNEITAKDALSLA